MKKSLEGRFCRRLRRLIVGKRGDIASSELSNLIHKFHQGPPRELFVEYNTNRLEAPVPQAIATGVLDKDKIPPELLERLAASIRFYEDREAAEHTPEGNVRSVNGSLFPPVSAIDRKPAFAARCDRPAPWR